MPLLEFIRYHRHLTGTKTGCNEGDCGACTVLLGTLVQDQVQYRSYTSCLTPLGTVQGKHVVTIEGLNIATSAGDNTDIGLNPIQRAFYEESATQCGFCTPGFVVSLTGFCLDNKQPCTQLALAAMDGNICRCTGYKSIERAALKVASLMKSRDGQPVDYLVAQHILPGYFSGIRERLVILDAGLNGGQESHHPGCLVAGGTDLYVQKHDEIKDTEIRFLNKVNHQPVILRKGNRCIIDSSATVTDLLESPLMQEYFPRLNHFVKLVSSTPIRNMATLAGNFVNASPIGDFTIFFLALDAHLVLKDQAGSREIPLSKFYKGYKNLNKKNGELVDQIWFDLPTTGSRFNFEKVSKRTHLDIASVNSAIRVFVKDDVISDISISAGGVGPVPMLLDATAKAFRGKKISWDTITSALAIVQDEIAPMSDARGSENYKRLLLNQLIKAHFIVLFPELGNISV